jgi:hypothetical protein
VRFACGCAQAYGSKERERYMQHWQYRKFETKGNKLISVENEPIPGERMTDLEHLNAFGKDGWELVAITVNQSSGNSTFFMKRPKP